MKPFLHYTVRNKIEHVFSITECFSREMSTGEIVLLESDMIYEQIGVRHNAAKPIFLNFQEMRKVTLLSFKVSSKVTSVIVTYIHGDETVSKITAKRESCIFGILRITSEYNRLSTKNHLILKLIFQKTSIMSNISSTLMSSTRFNNVLSLKEIFDISS